MFLKNKFFWIFVFLIAIIFCVIKYNPFRIRTMCRVTSSFLCPFRSFLPFPLPFNRCLHRPCLRGSQDAAHRYTPDTGFSFFRSNSGNPGMFGNTFPSAS